MRPWESDGDLIERSRSEPRCFSAVYDRHRAAVTRYVVRRVGNDPGEDLASEVFVRAFRARERFVSQHESALPWLLGVANHIVADYRRAERRRLSALEKVARSTPDAIEHEYAGLTPALVNELRRIPQIDRDTLLLVVWGELSYDEAATALSVPVGTVRSRIARARSRLAAAIGQGERPQPSAELALNGEPHV